MTREGTPLFQRLWSGARLGRQIVKTYDHNCDRKFLACDCGATQVSVSAFALRRKILPTTKFAIALRRKIAGWGGGGGGSDQRVQRGATTA